MEEKQMEIILGAIVKKIVDNASSNSAEKKIIRLEVFRDVRQLIEGYDFNGK